MTVETDILSGGRGSKTEGSDGSSKKGNRGAKSSRTIEQNVLDALVYRGIISQAEVLAAVDDSKAGTFDLETVLLDRYRVPKHALGSALSDFYQCPYLPYDERTVIDADLLKTLNLDSLKKIALRWGTYYRLDRVGQLHPQGASDSDQGIAPEGALESQAIGDHRGLVFIDTVDGQSPRVDNMGTLVLDTDYLEGLLVVQGHMVLRPRAAGKSVPVLSPSPPGTQSLGARVPVQLSGIHVNGLLYAAGAIRIERSARLYGAMIAGQSVTSIGTGTVIEVWYNADLAQGLFRGLPVVYRAPGTWLVKY
ncbi:MAG: hypothetical protein E6K65_07930 [Nitrospirae bacterium]|nr:MAG: hypothetical protein E6K65_07930 [Nitrospirota bacterium]